jgi:hypothetical protein
MHLGLQTCIFPLRFPKVQWLNKRWGFVLKMERHYGTRLIINTSNQLELFFNNHIQISTGLKYLCSWYRVIKYLIERLGRVLNNPASYSGGAGLKSWPEDRLSLLRFFVAFLSPFSRIMGDNLKIMAQPLPSGPFPIHNSLINLSLVLYILSYWKRVVK